jgi:hypothetical protein
MNPFEIRLQLLKLAQEIENERAMNERIRLENDWHAARSELPFPKIPTVSVEDVIKAAESLNAFVSKKDA